MLLKLSHREFPRNISFFAWENSKKLSHSKGKFSGVKMQLEKFLFFYDLELGGVIIGFYHLIIYSLLAVVAIVSFFVAPIYCELKIDSGFTD